MSVRLWAAILAAAQILTAGTALADVIGLRWAALGSLVIGAAQAGTAVYTRSAAPSDAAKPPPLHY